MMRQAKLAAFVQVALETDLGRFAGVNDSMGIATGLGVQAARAMTTFAAHVDGIGSPRHQARMRGRREKACDLLMAGGALGGAHKGGAGNVRRHDQRLIERAAGNHRPDQYQQGAAENECEPAAARGQLENRNSGLE